MPQHFYSHGKLLLAGEYTILDGGLGLALPTKYGQSLKVFENDSGTLTWKSLDHHHNLWFEDQFTLSELKSSKKIDTALFLSELFGAAQQMNPSFLSTAKGYLVETVLDFPQDWGLGSSSTLINNVAQWAGVDAHNLLWQTMGGSGYDISCAQSNRPLLYRLQNGVPVVEKIDFEPPFKQALFFVHLNKKQDSRAAIENYRNQTNDKISLVTQISALVKQLAITQHLSEFEALLIEHESLLSRALGTPPVRQSTFPDYFGQVKSLGGWGGDFVMATGNEKTPQYFQSKGFSTILTFDELFLNKK